MTKEEILKAAEYCLEHGDSCQGCPLIERGGSCTEMFADYILKEKEPVPQSSDTSSNQKKFLQEYNNTISARCQALKDGIEIVEGLVADFYNSMSETEKRCFDLGEVYRDMLSARNEAEDMKLKEEIKL